MELEVRENAPRATKLLNSLRHLDYSNEAAICDIVDNSVDAQATVIRVAIVDGKHGPDRIAVYDNGVGMAPETLSEALRLGSETEKDHANDLGRYGMGLVTASLSMAKKLSVVTYREGHAYSEIQDLDFIAQQNRFLAQVVKISDSEAKNFLGTLQKQTSATASSGTAVILENVDKWSWSRSSAAEKHLISALGQTFRFFIKERGLKIYVNNKNVEAIDPISDFKPSTLAEQSFKIDGKEIVVKLYELEDGGRQANTSNKINITNQGFYIIRNGREISAAETLGLFTKHNDYNRFRAEFHYTGDLDHVLNAGFTKQKIGIQSNAELRNQLHQFVQPYLKQVRDNKRSKEKDERTQKEDFTNAEKHISRKAHLLKTAEAEIEQRQAKKNSNPKPRKETDKERSPRLNIQKKKRIHDASHLKVRFDTKQMDKTGPLYVAEKAGGHTLISWNIDHPFYENFIMPNAGNQDVLNPIAYLIYSLAEAELRSGVNSDSEIILENIRADLSANLRTLMKTD